MSELDHRPCGPGTAPAVTGLGSARRRRWPFVVAGVCLAANLTLVISTAFSAAGGAYLIPWLTFLIMGAIVSARVPGNSVGPICLVYSVQVLVGSVPIALAIRFAGDSVPWYEPVGWAVNTPSIMLLFAMLARFPDGRLLDRRWRWLEGIAVAVGLVGGAAAYISNGWGGDPSQARIEGPLRADYGTVGDGLQAVFAVSLPLLAAAVAASLVLRYRGAGEVQRIQMRWLMLAVAVLLSVGLFTLPPDTQQPTTVNAWINGIIVALPPLAIGIAIVRHRLYDIDLLISRSLIYGSIITIVTGLYVAIVFGVGSLLGLTNRGSPILPLAATVVIAVAALPLRTRLERVANRIVYGRRATPYEVLSAFTHQVAAADDRLITDVAESVAKGTKATGASVWNVVDGKLRLSSVWPVDAGASASSTVADRGAAEGRDLQVRGASETYRIEHEGELVGALGVELPAGEALPPAERALVEELTAGVGLALWNRSLTTDLQASVDRLRASRRRLVAIQDATRYSLERDLHDGVQQRLVAVKVRLSIARQLADKLGALDTAATLTRRCDEAGAAIESLRDFARGVYPPVLELEGLRHALQARIDRWPEPIALSCPIERRQPREIEAAVYFSLSEILAALGDLAQLGAVGISLVEDGEAVVFVVIAEHGPEWSFEPPRHVEDRIDALDGTFSVITDPESTTVRGTVPVGRTPDDGGVGAAAGEPVPEELVEW